MNENLPVARCHNLSFINGWLQKFQSRWNLRSCKSHGESGYFDVEVLNSSLHHLQNTMRSFELRNVFNANLFGNCYRIALDLTIAESLMEGRNKYKTRLIYFACANGDGTDKIPLLCIGKYRMPHVFPRRQSCDWGSTITTIRRPE